MLWSDGANARWAAGSTVTLDLNIDTPCYTEFNSELAQRIPGYYQVSSSARLPADEPAAHVCWQALRAREGNYHAGRARPALWIRTTLQHLRACDRISNAVDAQDLVFHIIEAHFDAYQVEVDRQVTRLDIAQGIHRSHCVLSRW